MALHRYTRKESCCTKLKLLRNGNAKRLWKLRSTLSIMRGPKAAWLLHNAVMSIIMAIIDHHPSVIVIIVIILTN